MLRRDHLKSAAEDIVAAALMSQGWDGALLRLAHAAGARDAVLMRNSSERLIAAVVTEEAASSVAAFASGNAPPNSRYGRVKTALKGGFRVDHDDYDDDELARDPFYQEFLRPSGVFWHANVAIGDSRKEIVELSLKRKGELGPYQPEDVKSLDSIVDELRAAARIAKHLLDAETRGMKQGLARRGETVIELDSRGQVLGGQNLSDPSPGFPLRFAGKRLIAAEPAAQVHIEAALKRSFSAGGRISLAQLPAPDGRRFLLQILPVPGRARDVFASASAIAIVTPAQPDPAERRLDPSMLRGTFGLTEREAEMASLLAEGFDLATIAGLLSIATETVRTHLKSTFEKTGTARQAELVALLARLKS